ncbi:MAG: hypothetical protein CMH78_03220 [Nitrospinae bacterium]|nr:hypothetical protein [Nitrospinota bacterium]|tara:strand:+ start:2289 stop:3014 length:726 start_codon:yes stop_codon:yes gene_type:complete
MEDKNKTKEQLANELKELRQKNRELEYRLESILNPKKNQTSKDRSIEKYLDDIILNLPIGLAILEGEDFRYFRINNYLADINGLSVEAHLGKPLSEVLPHLADKIIPNMQKVLATGQGIPEREFLVKLPDAGTKYLMDYHFPIGKNAIVAIVKDITKRRQAEEALKESDMLFKQITENINEVFWVITPDGEEMIYVSSGYEKIWGKSCASLYENPRDWINSIHPDDKTHIENSFAENIAKK